MAEYERDAEIDGEIAGLPPMGSTELCQHVSTRGASLAPETLVHVMRAAAIAHRTDVFDLAGALLFGVPDEWGIIRGGHCEKTLRSCARKGSFVNDSELYRDYAQQVFDLVLGEIRNCQETRSFFEANFRTAFFRSAVDVAIRIHRARRREQAVPLEEELLPTVDAGRTERFFLGEINRQVLCEVIGSLPARQREAATLAWIDRYPKAGAGDTVASILNVSEANVHKLLNKSQTRLMADSRVRAMVEDRESA